MKRTVTDLLKYLRVPVSADYCEQLIASHPNYPSLLSIVDTLDRLGIPNIAARIEKDKLVDLSYPYILQLTRRSDLITIKGPSDLTKHKDKLDDWEGIVLQIEGTEKINDAENNRLYKRERIITLVTYTALFSVLAPLLWSTFSAGSFLTTAISFTGIAGLVVGYLLVAKDIGVKFEVIENFCTPAGKKNDCEEILNSEAASLFGFLKLSDMVFIYFICQLCCLASLAVLPDWRSGELQVLSALSLLASPMVIYSIVYQYKLKAWCKLCLIVDGILVAQAAFFLTETGLLSEPFNPRVTATMLGVSLVVFAGVIVIKSQLEDIIDLRKTASDNARIKNAHQVFGLLASASEREVAYNSPDRLVSGPQTAPLKFVMASNLYCKPCGVQHTKIEQLRELYPELVSVEYRFIVARDHAEVVNSNQYLIEFWMRNIRGREDETEALNKMMTDWYELMDLGKFREKYPLGSSSVSAEAIAMEQEHLDWTSRQKILRTPTIFLNGRKLPAEYWPLDLTVMAPALADVVIASQKVNSDLKSLV